MIRATRIWQIGPRRRATVGIRISRRGGWRGVSRTVSIRGGRIGGGIFPWQQWIFPGQLSHPRLGRLRRLPGIGRTAHAAVHHRCLGDRFFGRLLRKRRRRASRYPQCQCQHDKTRLNKCMHRFPLTGSTVPDRPANHNEIVHQFVNFTLSPARPPRATDGLTTRRHKPTDQTSVHGLTPSVAGKNRSSRPLLPRHRLNRHQAAPHAARQMGRRKSNRVVRTRPETAPADRAGSPDRAATHCGGPPRFARRQLAVGYPGVPASSPPSNPSIPAKPHSPRSGRWVCYRRAPARPRPADHR